MSSTPKHGGVPLGEYFTLQRGTTYKSRLLGQSGPVLLGLGTIARNGGFRGDSLKTYGGESPDNLLVREGDLYLSLKDVTQSADLLGAVARLPRGVGIGRLTQDTVRLIPTSDAVPLDYLYWVLRAPQYRDYCKAHATGTTNLGLAREDFLSFEVPPLTERRSTLASLLNSLDDKIELNRRTSATLEAMARALFKSWFVDFDPVRQKASGQQPFGMDATTAALFPDSFQDSTLGPIPKGWEVKSYGDICDVNARVLSKQDQLDCIDYIEISAVSRGVISEVVSYARGEEPSRARRRLKHGDTVLSTVRPDRGAYFLCLNPPESLIASTGFAVFSPRDVPWSFVYLGLTMPEVSETLGLLADGGAYPAVRPEAIAGIEMALPVASEISSRFHHRVEKMLRLVGEQGQESTTLAIAREKLLTRLISDTEERCS